MKIFKFIFGEQPTIPQKAFAWFMVSTLLLWPIFFFVSIFFFDAPIRSAVDNICRMGMVLTIWLYPLYLFPLMALWFRLSKRMGATWLFYFCPLIPVAVFSLFLAICSSEYAERKPKGYDPQTFKRINDAYAVDANHVYYLNDVLEGANPTSFHALDENYAVDSQRVWYNGDSIVGADPSTFVAPSDTITLSHDIYDYYKGAQALHVEDMETFKQIDNSWAIDNQNVYYLNKRVENKAVSIGDYRTFRALNNFYAADDKHVYYENNLVEGADPKSFEILEGQYHYAKDKNRVYYKAYGSPIRDFAALRHKNMEGGLWDAFHTDGKTVYNPELMPMPSGTDFATIHRVEPYRDWYADKAHVYYGNHLLPEANPKTFKVFPSHYISEVEVSSVNKSSTYSHDDSHVYCRDSLMYGVDIPSFICGQDFVSSQSFAFDKNRFYQGEPNPRINELRKK